MVSVLKVYVCDEVRVECAKTQLFTITDNSGAALVLFKHDLTRLYEILGKMVEDGVIEEVKKC